MNPYSNERCGAGSNFKAPVQPRMLVTFGPPAFPVQNSVEHNQIIVRFIAVSNRLGK